MGKAQKALTAAYDAMRVRLRGMTSQQLRDATPDRLARSYGVPVAGADQCLRHEIGSR